MDESTPALQFDRAEDVADAQPRACASCSRAITDEYYSIADKLLCPQCAVVIRAQLEAPGRFWSAVGAGLVPALVGAAVVWGVREVFNLQLGIIAAFVGVFVGKGVARGSRSRGGWRWQLLAVGLTWLSIALSYAPDWYAAITSKSHSTAGIVISVLMLPIVPLIVGFKSPLSLLIDGFGLWEAWKLNKRRTLPLSGPHRVTAGAPPLSHV